MCSVRKKSYSRSSHRFFTLVQICRVLQCLKCLLKCRHMHLTFCRCGTCVDGAKPGQHGYCPTRKRKRKKKPQRKKLGGFRSNFQVLSPTVGMPSAHDNWGLCSMQCLPTSISLRTTTLQVF